ncbi:carbon-nitrogen family hydrolase [Limosilactobacillus sp. STM2_1]|uniref:Carbon-nitrogen family hydrolase n=1 Tax=Limosilactobacillus rudii TaxID=2759755 RepID=A0A7W3UMS2_9LACO|nr:carbon-nitrogen family hydrolase [Limosilactobacillus rudii]MBB1080378.1 carbon-nitrogen family hydrolase [Limosilactobacillus rudii]MBB1098404.1 carbon-nitrogen family hydrolase [Limosilactobacillus rudii]MCD7135412.1 carbon-nitrogen family hydrolase [Limosilactobacillus rudii]
MKLKVALGQLDIEYAQPEKNVAKVKRMVAEAATHNADVVVLPEMWNTGYALSRLDELADIAGQKTRKLLEKVAADCKIDIVGGSVATNKEGQYFNTTYIVDRTGKTISSYDKVHLFGLMSEDQYLTAGEKENYFTLAGVPSASFICYDLRFPEWVRTVACHGSEILYFPAEWPAERISQWKRLVQARAIENQAFVVAVNRVGDDPDNHFSGHSIIADPLGNILVDAGEVEQVCYGVVDLTQIKAVRGPIPVFKDRRPALYR